MEVVNVAKNKITSVKRELGHSVSVDTAANALAFGFTNALGTQFVEGELSEFEVELANKLCRDKYATEGWNFHGKSILG
jgi:lipoate-protein ligase A